jgi:hypothetical protein
MWVCATLLGRLRRMLMALIANEIAEVPPWFKRL